MDRRHVPPVMPTHIRQEVEHLNASMRHQRMMFSQEFLDFHFNIIETNKIRLGKNQSKIRLSAYIIIFRRSYKSL